jgi:hypothetical protein
LHPGRAARCYGEKAGPPKRGSPLLKKLLKRSARSHHATPHVSDAAASRARRRRANARKVGHSVAIASMLPFGRHAVAEAETENEPPERVKPADSGDNTMQFGVDIESVKKTQALGAPIAYGALWVGSWTQKYGWAPIEAQLKEARSRGVTPVINWWYWGDDISPQCVEKGCDDRRQGVHKDKETWFRMSRELADLIDKVSGHRGAIVVLETEFNKNGIETYKPFDNFLAEQMKIFHAKPNIKVALGFGNWGREHWNRFALSVAECDFLGTQLLQSSVRDAKTYDNTVDTLITGAKELQRKFGKPSLVIDLALSSYPEASYAKRQADVVKELFDRLPELKRAGVQGLIWRQVADNPKFDTSNYHGIAERYWGLLHADGTPKPAFQPFVIGMQNEAAHAAPAAGTGQPAKAAGAPSRRDR